MNETNERQMMLAGKRYRPADPELTWARQRARRLCRLFNQTTETEVQHRIALLSELFGRVGPHVEVEPPFYCDYGDNIHAGDGLYMNFGCVLLDCNRINIGRNVFMGPGVHIYAASHPIDPIERSSGLELSAPVRIGDDVWIGGGAIICPGVQIGDGSTIGAGSVVTRNIPCRVVAAGNPCRVLPKTDRLSPNSSAALANPFPNKEEHPT